MGSRNLLILGATAMGASLVIGVAGVVTARVTGWSIPAPGGMMGGGTTQEPMMVWKPGAGPIATPQDAAQIALAAVRGQGWDWLTVDEVHIFPAFYEVEMNDRDGFKGSEVYVNRSSGDAGPEMGPNMMWDSVYGMMGDACASSRSESDARALAGRVTSLALGDAERHHGYWELELKQGSAIVNQINVDDCTGAVVTEQMWQPAMLGTYAPNG